MRRIEGVSSRLLEAAKEEFLKKGFEASSVREIAEKAETSPRAIYTRFENKAALFDAIVKNAEKEFKQIFAEEKEKFYKGEYKNSKETYYVKMIEYAYRHEEEFLLILTKSKGTKYENFTKQLAQDDIKGLKTVLNNSAIKEFFPTIKNESTVLSFIENITYSFYDNLFSPLVKKRTSGKRKRVRLPYYKFLFFRTEPKVEPMKYKITPVILAFSSLCPHKPQGNGCGGGSEDCKRRAYF